MFNEIFKKSEKPKIDKKVEQLWETYRKYTRKLSTVTRKLAFAEGGIFWILKSTSHKFPTIIILGLFSLILYFIFDALQYYFIMADFDNLAQQAKNNSRINPNMKLSDIDESTVRNRGEFCFKVKLIFITISSVFLILSFVICFSIKLDILPNHNSLVLGF